MTDSARDNVVPLNAPTRLDASAARDPKDPLRQVEAYRKLTREWRKCLTPPELSLAFFLVDHTHGWGLETRKLTYREMIEGTHTSAGMGMTERQLRNILTALAGKGLIKIAPSRRDGLTISVCLDKEESAMLAIPKRVRTGKELPGGAEKNFRANRKEIAGRGGKKLPDYIREEYLENSSEENSSPALAVEAENGLIEKKEEPRQPELPAPKPSPTYRIRRRPTQSISEVSEDLGLRTATDPAPATRALPKASRKIDDSVVMPSELEKTWRATFEEHYAEVPGAIVEPWTMKTLAAVKAVFVKRWTGTVPELHEFMRWAVKSWSRTMAMHFSWMKRDPAPDLPSIRFMLAFNDHFIRAWNRRALEDRIQGLRGDEAVKLSLLLKGGKTEQEALLEIAEDRAAGRLRGELEKGKQEAARLVRIATLAHKEARKERLRASFARPAQPSVLPDRNQPRKELTEEDMEDALQRVAKMVEEFGGKQ
jgi:hypothetical protein